MRDKIEPKVGMGATMAVGSDSYPYTIIEVKSPRRIVVQADNYTRTDKRGYYTEAQQYAYTPNPDGTKLTLSLRKNGYWRTVGSDGGTLFFIGNRRAYRDPSF